LVELPFRRIPVLDPAGKFMKGDAEEEALREAEANLSRIVGSDPTGS
jgi:hypothetical protein